MNKNEPGWNILKSHALVECAIVALVIFVFTFAYLRLQPPISAGNRCGFDGREYVKVFQKFQGIQTEFIYFPFGSRVGTPYLAYLTGIHDAPTAFALVNLISSVIFSFTIYAIARCSGFSLYYSMLALLLTLTPFFSPLRAAAYCPVYADPPFLALISMAFLFLINNQFAASFIVLLISYFFREAALYISPLFLLAALYIRGVSKRPVLCFAIMVAGMLCAKYLLSQYAKAEGGQLKMALYWTWRGLSDPERFIAFFAAISMTAAPLLYLKDKPNFSKIESISIVGFFGSAALSFFGGSDCTRIFYSFFPLYFLAILGIIRHKGLYFSLVCMVGYFVTNRFGAKILEPFNLIPNRDESGFFWQHPDHARPEVSVMILSIWFLLFAIYEKTSIRSTAVKGTAIPQETTGY